MNLIYVESVANPVGFDYPEAPPLSVQSKHLHFEERRRERLLGSKIGFQPDIP
jgi:hypothetical protein